MPAQVNERETYPASTVSRTKSPVFVLGCGRSGTKLLYHMLLSSGNFALYESESNAFNLLGVRFGNLRYRRNRERLLKAWFHSKLFKRSGLSREEIERRILEDCQNTGDFLRIFMETIAAKQGVERWAESTPLHTLYLPLIKKLIPDALVVHIIRDGRDVAVSLNKIGWISPFFWDKKRRLLTGGIFWKWIVSKGRRYGRALGADYMEIHYEELVNYPRETLAKIGNFIGQELDYDEIRKVALGSIENPNSSFRGDAAQQDVSPVGRWKTVLSAAEVAALESVTGDLLVKTGYSLAEPKARQKPPVQLMSLLYPAFWNMKFWLKTYTPLAKIADLGRMGLNKD